MYLVVARRLSSGVTSVNMTGPSADLMGPSADLMGPSASILPSATRRWAGLPGETNKRGEDEKHFLEKCLTA